MIKNKITLNETRESAIARILNENDAKVGVEIGVFKGKFSKAILEKWPGTLYMVDPWRPLGDEYFDSSNHKIHTTAFSDTMDSIKGFEDRAFMIRALSNQAINLFQDDSLDYVYIDGNHAYDWVKEDIELWWPKLKSGGVLAGHDYLLVNWERNPKLKNNKDMHVYADGDKWQLTNYYDPNFRIKYAGIFGVNPAVHEFAESQGLDYDLTNEWTSTFIIRKP
jgi:predicted O-methyltransferase YrrM